MTDATDRMTEFVDVPGNPRPDGAELVWFTGSGGRTLRACMAPSPRGEAARGTVLVCPGRTEFIEKYFEVARELQAKGFAVLILDWPGQGLSDRLLEDSRKGHIDNFQTFMGALQRGLDAMGDRLPKPYVSLAHSMGGAIALAALTEGLVKVQAAAFVAPMWGIRTRVLGMRYLVWAMRVMGRSGDYAQQPGPPERFESNIVTNDRARWQMHRDLVDAVPELDLGPITWGWLGASLDILRTFAKSSKIAGLDFPFLVATAEDEKLVDNRAHNRIANQHPDCEHILVEGAMHEILMEVDEKRAEFWAAFDRLLERAKI
ncbi:MAG: alpha/beta hydrolase [Pseudomonadota bacterium]